MANTPEMQELAKADHGIALSAAYTGILVENPGHRAGPPRPRLHGLQRAVARRPGTEHVPAAAHGRHQRHLGRGSRQRQHRRPARRGLPARAAPAHPVGRRHRQDALRHLLRLRGRRSALRPRRRPGHPRRHQGPRPRPLQIRRRPRAPPGRHAAPARQGHAAPEILDLHGRRHAPRQPLRAGPRPSLYWPVFFKRSDIKFGWYSSRNSACPRRRSDSRTARSTTRASSTRPRPCSPPSRPTAAP
jgi:hypothetical protein